jgi:hypothetical protein
LIHRRVRAFGRTYARAAFGGSQSCSGCHAG